MMKKILVAVAFLFCFSIGLAFAQEGKKPDDQGWEPVNGSMMVQPGESIPASRLVAGAYGFIFAAVVVFVASVTARTRRVEEEMAELSRKISSSGK